MSYERMKDKVMDALKGHFRPEFLNRIDELIVFHELARDEVMQMVDLMTKRLTGQLESQGLGIELTQSAKELLAEKGYDPQLGARPLRRAIQRMIEDALSEKILYKEFHAGEIIVVDTEDDPDKSGRASGSRSAASRASSPRPSSSSPPPAHRSRSSRRSSSSRPLRPVRAALVTQPAHNARRVVISAPDNAVRWVRGDASIARRVAPGSPTSSSRRRKGLSPMLDLFLYCDLASTHVSARGDLTNESLAELVRMIDQLPDESTVVVDLGELSSADHPTLELLRDAIVSRADDTGSVFRVIEPADGSVPADGTAVDAA